jgi:hypothetical protein
MKMYREWARKVNRRQGMMVDLKTLERLCLGYDPGYSSVYMFDESAAAEIKQSRSSAGLDKYTVYADSLAIDIDGGQHDLMIAQEKLVSRCIGFDVWSSGGKGYHLYIKHELMGSPHLPWSHRKFVEGLSVPHDATLYQHGRILSLPGRVHPRTKQKKTFVTSVPGDTVTVPIVEKPEPRFDFDNTGGLGELQFALYGLSELSMHEPTAGNRHTLIWGVSSDLANAGVSFEAVLELMQGVNSQWKSPKPADEVELAVSQAFKRPTRRTS